MSDNKIAVIISIGALTAWFCGLMLVSIVFSTLVATILWILTIAGFIVALYGFGHAIKKMVLWYEPSND